VLMLPLLVIMTFACSHERGHSALATLALLEEQSGEARERAIRRMKSSRCAANAFHDAYSGTAAMIVFLLIWSTSVGWRARGVLSDLQIINGSLNMTELALRFSGYVTACRCAMAKCRAICFQSHIEQSPTRHATPGPRAHAALFDRTLPKWREDNCFLRYAVGIPLSEIRQAMAGQARAVAPSALAHRESSSTRSFYTGICPRATGYKRAIIVHGHRAAQNHQ